MTTITRTAMDACETFEYLAEWHQKLYRVVKQARADWAIARDAEEKERLEAVLSTSTQTMTTLRDIGRLISRGESPELSDDNPFGKETDF